MSTNEGERDTNDLGLGELAAEKWRRFSNRVKRAYSEPASAESQGRIDKTTWETEEQRRAHPWPEFKRVMGSMIAGMSVGGFIGLWSNLFEGQKFAEQALLEKNLTLKTKQGSDLYNRIRNEHIMKTSIREGLKYTAVVGLFTGIQMGAGVYRGVHDLANTLAAATFTGAIAGLVTQKGRGLLWGSAYGIAFGSAVAASEVFIRMLDDDSSSSLPAQEYVKPTQDYAAAVRADMEAEIEIDIAAQQKYQQQPLQAERSDKKTKEESL